MPAKTDKARQWAKDHYDELQQTAAPHSVQEITTALFHHVDGYKGGDRRLFLYSSDHEIFFFNINSSRIGVKDLVSKVAAGGGLVFGSSFSNGTPEFFPILGIQSTVKTPA